MSLFSDEDINVREVHVSGPMSSRLHNVHYVPTPIFDAHLSNCFKITLTGNVTSSSLISARAGQRLTFMIMQDGVGSRTFAWPANVINGMVIGDGANQVSIQDFLFDGTNAYPVAPPTVN